MITFWMLANKHICTQQILKLCKNSINLFLDIGFESEEAVQERMFKGSAKPLAGKVTTVFMWAI